MLVIKNALIVTMDAEKKVYRNGSIWIEENEIKKIGPADKVGVPEGEHESIDASEMIAIPGFISAHNHLYSAVVRSLPYGGPEEETDQTFISWIERFWSTASMKGMTGLPRWRSTMMEQPMRPRRSR